MKRLTCEELMEKMGERKVTANQILDYFEFDKERHHVLAVETDKTARALKPNEEIDLETSNNVIITPYMEGG